MLKNGKIIELHEGANVVNAATSSLQVASGAAEDTLLNTRDVLSRIKDELGLDTDLELADVMGVGIRRIHNWKHRNTVPTEEIVAVCGKEGLDLQYVLTGQKIGLGRSGGQGENEQQTQGGEAACNVDSEHSNKPRDSFTQSSCGHPLIHPPYKAYTQRADNGEVLTSFVSPQIVDVLAPGLNWLNHSLGVAPENFLLVKVLGDNMAPWLQDGDLVMVDAGIKTTINGGCLLLRYADGMMMVRRVFRNQDGTFLAKCDNECCPPDIIDPNNNMTYPIVVGRVVRRLVR
ncbi:LexA family transcriptional regulator [Trichlorobacter lovleyi]|uniref:LexA family transcriptional regulator n=1 Tax=Trichlorobacter lovleyi TaxID=313985 RepID=UPI0022408F01|nr:LexA family transcriptional regulator [Trichlorobacter lovleyi]QOX78122.1 LexA family transcriptional regulator [Trichlorobacter lovleyi]